MMQVPEVKKGRQLRVVGGKYRGTKGWVNLSKGKFGFTDKAIYIIYIDRYGNEVEHNSYIMQSSVKYVDWCPDAPSAMKYQVQHVPEDKKGDQLRVVGGTYKGRKGWVNVSRGTRGYTPESVYIIILDPSGIEREASHCIRIYNVEMVDWNSDSSTASTHRPEEVVSSTRYSNKDEVIRKLQKANLQLEKALKDEKEKVQRLEETLQNIAQSASGTLIKKEIKVKKEKMRRARLSTLAP